MNENQNDQKPVVLEQKTVLPAVMQLTKQSFAFYRAHFKTLVFIGIVPFILSVLAALSADTNLNGFASLIATVANIAACIVILEYVAKNGVLEQGLKNAYLAGFKKFFPFIWVSILALFPIWGGIVLFVIPGIYLAIALSFSMYALIIENRRGMSALVQSWHYVKGYWWPVFGRFAFFWLIMVLVFAVISIISSILGISPDLAVGTKSDPAYIILNDLANIFFMAPLSFVYMFGIYQSLKTIKPAVPAADDEKRIRRNIKIFLVIGIVGIIAFVATALYLSAVSNINFDDPQSLPTLMPNINS